MSFLSLLHYPTLQIHHTQKSAIPHQPFQNRTIPRPAPPHLPPLSKVRCCRPKKFGRLPEGLPHQPFAPHQPFKNRTIPPTFRRVSVCVCLYGFASVQNSGHTRLRHPCLFMNALLALRPAKPLGVHFRHPCLACPSRCTNSHHSYSLLKRTSVPRLTPTSLPPLSKGGGLTARHKP